LPQALGLLLGHLDRKHEPLAQQRIKLYIGNACTIEQDACEMMVKEMTEMKRRRG
jgi:hypothetical protein